MAIPWHRIFGMALKQYFAGTAWKVEVEVDLSLKQQRLDIVVLRHLDLAVEPLWPDGFGPPAEHNLITFKALKDPLNAWAMKELAGHGVNYRKSVSPDLDHLLPESHFRLLAASMHFPRQLAGQVNLQAVSPGAYDVQWATDTIRVLVLREMPEAEQNVVWNLFSGEQNRIASAFDRLKPRLRSYSSLVNKMLRLYGLEGISMPYTMEEFEREVRQEVLEMLTPEQLLSRLTEEQRLQGIPPEHRLKGLPPEHLLAHLSEEQRLQGIPPEHRLKGLPPEHLLAHLSEEQRLQGIPPEHRLKGLPPEQLLSRLTEEQRLQGIPPEHRLKGMSAQEIEDYLKKLKAEQDKTSAASPSPPS